jgi:HSP20 family protein
MSEEDKRAAGFGKIASGLSQIINFLLELDERQQPHRGRREEGGVVIEYSFKKRGLSEEAGEEEAPEPSERRARRPGLRRGRASGIEVLEPVTDFFDEPDEIVLLFELPGVSRKDIGVSLCDDILLIEARSSGRLYRKETLIEAKLRPGAPRLKLRNGVLEVRLKKERSEREPQI